MSEERDQQSRGPLMSQQPGWVDEQEDVLATPSPSTPVSQGAFTSSPQTSSAAGFTPVSADVKVRRSSVRWADLVESDVDPVDYNWSTSTSASSSPVASFFKS